MSLSFKKSYKTGNAIFVVCFQLSLNSVENAEILFSPHPDKRRKLTEDDDSQLLNDSEDECKVTNNSSRLE